MNAGDLPPDALAWDGLDVAPTLAELEAEAHAAADADPIARHELAYLDPGADRDGRRVAGRRGSLRPRVPGSTPSPSTLTRSTRCPTARAGGRAAALPRARGPRHRDALGARRRGVRRGPHPTRAHRRRGRRRGRRQELRGRGRAGRPRRGRRRIVRRHLARPPHRPRALPLRDARRRRLRPRGDRARVARARAAAPWRAATTGSRS